ncbi:MAG: hypothetical protein NZ482_09420 [Gloeomargarita sp. SKYG98]|nr:hypothetical protein [Gloeomargarita sp. SKYG98]
MTKQVGIEPSQSKGRVPTSIYKLGRIKMKDKSSRFKFSLLDYADVNNLDLIQAHLELNKALDLQLIEIIRKSSQSGEIVVYRLKRRPFQGATEEDCLRWLRERLCKLSSLIPN